MGKEQHHAGMHFVRHGSRIDEEKPEEKKKSKPMKCRKCGSVSLALEGSGKKYSCRNCSEMYDVTKNTDLASLESASSPSSFLAAMKYQAGLCGKLSDSPRCPVCRTLLKRHGFCPKCQMYRKTGGWDIIEFQRL